MIYILANNNIDAQLYAEFHSLDKSKWKFICYMANNVYKKDITVILLKNYVKRKDFPEIIHILERKNAKFIKI